MNEKISDQRLLTQHIEGTKWETPEQVVKHLGAVQAQDYHQAVWAIGLRMKSGSRSAVEQAIADRKIVLTWPLRGTIHFVAAEDARWMLELSAPRLLAQDQKRMDKLELSTDIIDQSRNLIHDALKKETCVSRPRLMELLEEAGISTKSGRGYYILWYFAQTGMICFGPLQGKQQTYVLLEDWVSNSRTVSGEEASAELALRYFHSHGPATVQDFAWWSGLTITAAKIALAAIQSELYTMKIDKKEYWMSANVASFSEDTAQQRVHFLPGFDEYYLGYKDRSDVIEAEHAKKIVPGSNAVFQPMIIVNGQVAGTWKRILTRKGVEIILDSFIPLQNFEGNLYREAERYCSFLGQPLLGIH